MQHSGNREILNVGVLARTLSWNIRAQNRLADDRVCRRFLQRRVTIDGKRELLAADQIADADAVVDIRAACQRAHLAVIQREFGSGPMEALRAQLEQRLTGRRRGLPNFHAAAGEARAAACRSLIRRQRRVALNERHPVHGNVQLLGGHLTNRNPQPGAEVHLARIDRNRAIGVHGEEGIDLLRVDGLAKIGIRRSGLSGAARSERAERKADDERVCALEEIATRN